MPQRTKTRSRSGCLTCRQRHIRCDEQHPSCQKCLASQRPCNYSTVAIPLRDRRMLEKKSIPPGQHAPWALIKTPSVTGVELRTSTAMDPFDMLPVKMPFKSQELYHYFYQSGAAFAAVPSDPKEDCIALANLDEHALRSTIIIAGIHYSWNTGTLQSYNSAFLFHKVESIRIINKWLEVADSKTFVVCVRQILTISLAEACLGNITAAETHLNGIMALFDSRGQLRDPWSDVDDIAVELTNRYLLLVSSFVTVLKSRLAGFALLCATQGILPNDDGSSAAALRLMKMWHRVEKGGLPARLKSLRMFPYFFSLPPMNRRPKSIDPWPTIECLRSITEMVDHYRIKSTAENLNEIWSSGGPTRLLVALVDAHVLSFANDEDGPCSPNKKKSSTPPLQTSWSGIAAAAELYMHSILVITNGGEPIECRQLYRILLIMRQDISRSRGDLSGDHGQLGQALWLWKIFTGILALAKSQCYYAPPDTNYVECSCDEDMKGLHKWFFNCARAWSRATGMIHLEDVELELVKIAWPAAYRVEYAADVWAEAISSNPI